MALEKLISRVEVTTGGQPTYVGNDLQAAFGAVLHHGDLSFDWVEPHAVLKGKEFDFVGTAYDFDAAVALVVGRYLMHVKHQNEILASKVWTEPDLEAAFDDYLVDEYPGLVDHKDAIIEKALENGGFSGLGDCQDWEWAVLHESLEAAAVELGHLG